MQESVKDRIKTYLKVKNITATSFCQTLKVSQGFLSSMRESLQPDKIKSIAINFPDLNIGWLMTGIGEMLSQSHQNEIKEKSENITITKEVVEIINSQATTILSQQRTIEELMLKVRAKDDIISDYKNTNVG